MAATFRPCAVPPAGIDRVTVVALAGDSLVMTSAGGRPRLLELGFEPFEPLESVVKGSLLISWGALADTANLIGTLDDTLVYAALVVSLDNPAPPEGERRHLVPFPDAAQYLCYQLGPAADHMLTDALTFRRTSIEKTARGPRQS